jgi:hypothetical protein
MTTKACSIIPVCVFLMLGMRVLAQFPAQPNTTFDRGEDLKYAVYFHSILTGNIKAGLFETKVTLSLIHI